MRALFVAAFLGTVSCAISAAIELAPAVTAQSCFSVNRYGDAASPALVLGNEISADAFVAGGMSGTWSGGSFGAQGYYFAGPKTVGIYEAYLSFYASRLLVSLGKQTIAWGQGQTYQPTFILSFLGPIDGPFATVYNTAQVWAAETHLTPEGSDSSLMAAIDSDTIEGFTPAHWYAMMWRQTFYPTSSQYSYDLALLERGGKPVAHVGSDLQWSLSTAVTLIASGDFGVDVSEPAGILRSSVSTIVASKSFLVGIGYADANGLFGTLEGGYNGYWAGGIVLGYSPPGSPLSIQCTGRSDLEAGAFLGSIRVNLKSSQDVTNVLQVQGYGGDTNSPLSTTPVLYQIRYFIEYRL